MKLIFAITGLLLYNGLQAQDILKAPDVLPQSPEGASFAKNVNIPVSYSSGTPQINIPFYTVKSGMMEVPVSISYNASGIRVEEVATWVGLGWNLNAGGQITRTIRGTADERPDYGYMNVPANRKVKYVNTAHCRCGSGGTETWAIENDILNYQLDLEPDLFSFSAMGYSGDFYYNQDSGRYILVPYQNIWIEGEPGNFILSFSNGIRAYFGGENEEEVLNYGSTTSYIDGIAGSPEPIANTPQSNSWMLAQLKDPIGRTIEFTYKPEWIITFGRGGERFGPSLTSNNNEMRRQSFYKQYIKKPVLHSISGDNVNIYFRRSSISRADMPDYLGGSRCLDTILVTTKNGVELRSFLFEYGYFTSAVCPTNGILDIAGYAEVARKRMFLRSITEKNGSLSMPPYEFYYNELDLPSRFSTAQDYWGYYNGKENGTKLMARIPSLAFYPWSPEFNEVNKILPSYGMYLNNDGADRRIDSNYTQARILKKIKYPTGGTTEYEFEQNDVSAAQLNIYGGMTPPDMEDRSYSLSSFTNPLPTYPPYPLYFSGTFTVNVPATKIKLTPKLSNCTTYSTASCKLTVTIRSLPDMAVISSFNTTIVRNLQLTKGSYLVEVTVNGSSADIPPYFNLYFQWGERRDALNLLVGGVRVRKIISHDGVNNSIARTFSYNKESSLESSGLIEGCPSFKVHDVNARLQLIRQYYVSNSILPLTADGKTVRYAYVTEYYDSTKSSFKTAYSFSSGISEPPYFAKAKTGAPLTLWNWQNNLLVKKQVYEKTPNGVFRIVAAEESFSKAHKPLTDLYGLYGPQIIPYNIATEWYLPDSTTSFTYSYESGVQKVMKAGMKYFYNHKFLPSLTRTINSKGEVVDSKTWYPVDYKNTASSFIASLNAKKIWSVPVKQETSVNGKKLSGSLVVYNDNGLPLTGHEYENQSMIDTPRHNMIGLLLPDHKFRTRFDYDTRSNLIQVINYKSGPVSYIWDYQVQALSGSRLNEVPVAAVQNADTNDIAYTSFENSGKGNWTFSGTPQNLITVMGEKAYSLSMGSIRKANLKPAFNYIVSYWSPVQQNVSYSQSIIKGNTVNGWTYFEHKIANPITRDIAVWGTGAIDELRLYPENAQMTSYAYNQYGLVRAICDINNRIINYEYDPLGRLTLVRDYEGNIIKKFCYNYAGQVENCGLGTDPHWQLSNQYCEKADGENTGHLVKVETDINPKSAGYNQTRIIIDSNSVFCPSSLNGSCTGIDKKIIQGNCEIGIKQYVNSVRVSRDKWICYYYYKWSDNSTSLQYQEESTAPCL